MDGIMRMKMMRSLQLDCNYSDSQECLKDNDVVTLDDDFLGGNQYCFYGKYGFSDLFVDNSDERTLSLKRSF